MSAEPVADPAHARAAFDQWRAGHRRRGRLPEHLWALAVSLIPSHSAQTVARELGLNPGRLRASLARQRSSRKPRAATPAFVELRAIDPDSPPQPAPDAVLLAERERASLPITAQIERPDGTRLTLSLRLGHCGVLEEVCTAFLRA